ncbi:hypothetical protein COU57_02845 [Candidatus Pacearchaeota archaeon CG10_big_fil_rev_8_21_14_0_10_32_14]|nr:MAG: hypothetical protein COU57_02845 [Candidatus Pacearchaeota archaeon CG10_big_fil_rev_8_21_14_0_10_32_14]
MKNKNILVSFAVFVAIVLLATSFVAAKTAVTSDASVYIFGNHVTPGSTGDVIGVTEGETIPIRVVFTSDITASDIKIEANIDGYRVDVQDETSRFDVEQYSRYSKSLSLTIPTELRDELSDDSTLEITIFNRDYETQVDDIDLRVQRESYSVAVMSADTLQYVKAGQLLPVDIVLKNVGYNDLSDLYVTAKIPQIGVERRVYFGDLVAIECNKDSDLAPRMDSNGNPSSCDEDEEEVASGRLFLQIPEDAKAGSYTIEVEAVSEDVTASDTAQITVQNDFLGQNVISTVTSRTVNVGEEASYDVLIVNPTSKLRVYRIVPESNSDLGVSVSESVVAVPAGSSKTVKVMASSNTMGTYTFNVNVFSDEELAGKVTLTTKVEGTSAKTTRTSTNPVIVLTVVLAIIFVVLLIVLLVLIGKKPEKSEEFGESYY